MPNYTENLNLFKYDTTTDGDLPFNLQNALNANWDILDEAVNDKLDITEMQEVQCVIETYVNGTSWYRVYSDGWCEQGGLVTHSSTNGTPITYLKTMKNTNYCLICSYNGNNIGDNNYDYHCINLTVNGATLIVANNGTLTPNGIKVYWYVSGFLI